MFLEILKTLLQVIVVFSILIVAFGLSFYILMCGEVGLFSFMSDIQSYVNICIGYVAPLYNNIIVLHIVL